MTLPMGKQIIVYQGHYNRPIEADGEWHFLRKTKQAIEVDEKVKLGETTPIPEYLVPGHHRALRYAGVPRVYDPQTKNIKDLA